MENKKTITVISSVNLTLFKGLSQQDLTIDNKAQQNRLNVRPLWAQRTDAEGNLQRFDFKVGENECPAYIIEWESFKKLADNGTLAIKDSYTRLQSQAQADTKSLEEIKRLQEELAKARADKEKAEAELKKQKVKTIEA